MTTDERTGGADPDVVVMRQWPPEASAAAARVGVPFAPGAFGGRAAGGAVAGSEGGAEEGSGRGSKQGSEQGSEQGAGAGVRVVLPGVVGLLVIRADPARVALADALSTTLGLALPERLSSETAEGCCVRWMSPDEWLLSCAIGETFDVETRLREALTGPFSVTDVSGGYAVLELAGDGVPELLAKSTPLDVDPRRFGPGRVAGTVFAKGTATLRNVDGTRYELICRRSFADYVARWIAEAARGQGLAVDTGDHDA